MTLLEQLSPEQQEVFEDRCFKAWMAKVDAILSRRIGLVSDDLPDICYRDLHDDGASPSEGAREAIRYANEG